MRYHEIASGFRMPVSGEEQDMLRKIGHGPVAARSLGDERDGEVARLMVTRGLLDNCRDNNGEPAYRVNSVNDIWISRNG